MTAQRCRAPAALCCHDCRKDPIKDVERTCSSSWARCPAPPAPPPIALQSQRLRGRYDAEEPRRQLGVPEHPLLPCVPRLRLGHSGGLGLGSVARRRLSRRGHVDRCQPPHHHRRVAQRDRLGVNFARHGHVFTPEDWTALLDFFDKHARQTCRSHVRSVSNRTGTRRGGRGTQKAVSSVRLPPSQGSGGPPKLYAKVVRRMAKSG